MYFIQSSSQDSSIRRPAACRSELEEGHGDDKRAGAFLMWRQAESLQPEKEKALGRSCNSLPDPKGVYRKAGKGLFTRDFHDGTGWHGFKLREDRFSLDIKKKFPTVMVVRHRNRNPKKIMEYMFLKCSWAGWMGLWETLSSWRYPCPWQGAGTK